MKLQEHIRKVLREEDRYDDKVGKTFWFEYHCYESPESCDDEIWYRSHQKVKVIGVSEWSYDDKEWRQEDGNPRVYLVEWSDGYQYDVFEDELMESPDEFYRPSPPKRKIQETIRRILRIKSIMGVIKEEVDDACKLKNINLNTLQSYWEDKTKTEQEKITEVENFVKPFFTEAKTYMLKYIDSEWFNKKVQEKIGKGSKYNTEDLEKYKKQVIKWQNKVNELKNANIPELQKAKEHLEFFNDMVKEEEVKLQGVITAWDNKQKNKLKNFLNSVNLVFSLTCDDSTGGFVIISEYSKLNFCVKNVFPSDVNKNSIMLILVHEFNHCLSGYFISKGVDYLPEDAKGPQVPVSNNTNYGNKSIENASRVQNLKRLLGVDDFGTLDNFIKLIKDNVKIKSGNNLFNVYYENNLMKIPFKNAEDITLLDFELFINDTDAYDVKMLFNTEAKTVKDEYDTYIEVDLNKIYNYSQEFAKINTNSDVNYA